MSHLRPRPPSGTLRQLLARLQPATTAPAVASLAFAMLAPAALAQTATNASPAPAVPPTAAHETSLPTVKVEDTADPMEVNNGYQATETRVGRVKQDPHDVAQAVTSVTHQLMEEQQVGSLREALRNVSGLTFNAAEGGRAGDNMMLRGFYTFGDMYLDGIRDTAQYNRETFFLEQIDVLRGSASMLFGRGQAGGVINLVSKTPKRADAYTLTGSLGTETYSEVTADLNKRLGEDSAIRVNLMKRNEGSWRENPVTGTEPEVDRGGAQVSLSLGMQTDNEFNFSYLYLRNRDIPDYGFSFDNATRAPNTNFTPDTFWGVDGNFDDSDVNVVTGSWTHRFSPKTELLTSLRYGNYERSYWARTPSATVTPNADGTIPGNGGNWNAGPTRSMDYETLALQSVLTSSFRAWDMKHEVVGGVEYLHEDSHRSSLLNLGGTTIASGIPPLFQPYVEGTGGLNNFTSDSYALYLQDTVEFIPFWKATLGVRRDNLDAEYTSATSPQLNYGEWSYRAALSYQPTETAHYYFGYSDSFSPTADLYQLTVAPQPPETSEVYEIGAKWMFFDGDLSFRTALYSATKYWERSSDLESTAAILTKKRRTNGFELEAAGRITPNWEIFSGLALMDAEILDTAENVNATTGVITKGNLGYIGQRPRNTPEYTFNLWTTYALGGGWKIGGGVEVKGDRYGYNPSGAGAVPTLPGSTEFHPNTAPSYDRWDAMVAYEQKSWAARLNVKNLFDDVYYDSIYDNGPFTVPGTGRQIILTGELKY
ncbi:TonB-dependent siderophore receptor [Thiobacillus sp.]|uniref:TonB-dependent receptor n=1 Tax=Thiobacillus sp. TaxID=924 RepID=UPI00286D6B62|nr:TonB-dependent siderophore receptor [Thiobacillus sp.]